MCGIAGLFAKTPSAQDALGTHLADMLLQLADRGPDSSGVALYRDPAPPGMTKLSLLEPDGAPIAWAGLDDGQGVALVDGDAAQARAWLAADHPELLLLSAGHMIETTKVVGRPERLIARTGLRAVAATHALGHTRMATESKVTTAGSHPFSTGADLCLVHNGSLSNHNRLRARLRREGVTFQTENDSEVAAGFLTWRLQEGDTLEEALDAALGALDGFFTFAVGTRDGFAVLRDPIACKPAVIAETDDWVAMASEFRALAVLPGAEDADLWEPEPGRIYAWSRAAVPA